MSELALRLKDELLQLSEVDRLELAQFLWESVDVDETEIHPDSDDWTAELERRSADADAGRATEQPFREALAELRGEPS